MRKSDTLAYCIAIATGMALWFITTSSSGKREAWDDANYWSAAYPIAIVCSGLLGYLINDRPWRWALALFVGQFLAMTIRNGELGNLWPLGLLLFIVMSLPGVVIAKLAAWIHGRISPQEP